MEVQEVHLPPRPGEHQGAVPDATHESNPSKPEDAEKSSECSGGQPAVTHIGPFDRNGLERK